MSSKRKIIYGPPGTGKTTTLISIMEEALNQGIKPERIGFISFTKRSVEEAISRAENKFELERRDLPYFRTIHSICMGLSGLRNSDVFQWQHKKEIANLLGLEITFKRTDEDGTSFGMKEGDKMFHLSDYHRAKKISLKDAWLETGQEVDWNALARFDETYRLYKENKLLIDFTDMLERFIQVGYVPDLDVLFVDEAQDLSTLQWEAVFKLETKAEKSYIAGDDDQGIYGWNGSNVNMFINLEGERTVLEKSYRLTYSIYDLADKMIRQVKNRVPKDFLPKDHSPEDRVYSCFYLDDLPLFDGTWLLLARNTYLLKEYEEHCQSAGYLYTMPGGGGPTQWDEMKAIVDWERMRHGYEIKEQQWENIQQYSSDPSLVYRDAPWYDVLDNIGHGQATYLRACKRNNEKFLSPPRIHINTIHGVKGGEAENVCIMQDVANMTFKNMEENPEDETRVFYVGVTRAINKLYIKTPKTNKYYEIPCVG